MLPKNSLGRQQLRKLKVYAGPEHPHKAQQPVPFEITQVAQQAPQSGRRTISEPGKDPSGKHEEDNVAESTETLETVPEAADAAAEEHVSEYTTQTGDSQQPQAGACASRS